MKVLASDPQLPQNPVRKIRSQFLHKIRLFHSSVQQPGKLCCYYYSSISRFVFLYSRGKPPLKCSAATTIYQSLLLHFKCDCHARCTTGLVFRQKETANPFYLQVSRDTVEMNNISQHYKTDSLNYQRLKELRSVKAEGLVSQVQNTWNSH